MRSKLSPRYLIDVCETILEAMWDRFLYAQYAREQEEALLEIVEKFDSHHIQDAYIDEDVLDIEEQFH